MSDQRLTQEQGAWLHRNWGLVQKVRDDTIARRAIPLSAWWLDRVQDAAVDAAFKCARGYDPAKGSSGAYLGTAVARAVNREMDKARDSVETTPVDDSYVNANTVDFFTGDLELDHYAQAKIHGVSDAEYAKGIGVGLWRVKETRKRLKEVLIDTGNG